MDSRGRKRSIVRASIISLVIVANLLVPVHALAAIPGCQSVLSIFARGSQDSVTWNSAEAVHFLSGLQSELGSTANQGAELGNLDGDLNLDPNGYPAVKGLQWLIDPGYIASVNTGAVELANFLNGRNCPYEAIVLGGYSQGADVIGSALEWGLLSAAVRNRIAYIALYGDPRFDNGGIANCIAPARRQWVMVGIGCMRANLFSLLPSRVPYLPADFWYKTGSWCDDGDLVCRGDVGAIVNQGTHTTSYADHWIDNSLPLIALMARAKRNQLVGSQSWSPEPLYHGPVPDAFIIQSTDSNLYVAAGGRLFWFDKNNAGMLNAFRGQMQQKYGTTTYPLMAAAEVHAVEVNRTSTGAYSPGTNMPADNTFMYEYGTTQQYVIKYQHPFAVGDSNEVIALGGQDKAIMVPPGLADLQAHPAQWVQDDLLRFGTDPSVWHFVGQGYRVPSVPTRDCLMLRHNRGVTYMPASAWNYFPTHPTQQAACDFANDQWLFGTPSNQQIVTMYGAGYNVGSAEEVIALGGQNKAVPVADETVAGLLARTGSLPNDELVKSYNSPHVYHVVDNKLHYVGSPATRDCLSARSGKTVRTVPIDLIGRMQANGQTGANAYCELENRQLLGPDGTSVVYIKDGYKRPVGNPNIRNCIAVRTGAGQPVAVSANVWNSYTPGANAYCPYETETGLNFVQEAGDPTVWLVGPPTTPGQPGVRRHVGSLCVTDPYTTNLKKFHVWTVPAGETAGHVQGADFWASGELCGALPG